MRRTEATRYGTFYLSFNVNFGIKLDMIQNVQFATSYILSISIDQELQHTYIAREMKRTRGNP